MKSELQPPSQLDLTTAALFSILAKSPVGVLVQTVVLEMERRPIRQTLSSPRRSALQYHQFRLVVITHVHCLATAPLLVGGVKGLAMVEPTDHQSLSSYPHLDKVEPLSLIHI